MKHLTYTVAIDKRTLHREWLERNKFKLTDRWTGAFGDSCTIQMTDEEAIILCMKYPCNENGVPIIDFAI